jgi:hypothetical protein
MYEHFEPEGQMQGHGRDVVLHTVCWRTDCRQFFLIWLSGDILSALKYYDKTVLELSTVEFRKMDFVHTAQE